MEAHREGSKSALKPLDRIMDSEHMPPVKLAALAGLAFFVVAATAIEGTRALIEALGNGE